MTAAKLLDLLTAHGCDPAVVPGDSGPELEYLAPASAGVEEFVPLLRTGVVAVLGRRRWYGLDADGRAAELSPRDRIPAGVRYLAAERRPDDPGPGVWDAVGPAARRELAACFDPTAAGAARTTTKRTPA